jgi:hypothetical protein
VQFVKYCREITVNKKKHEMDEFARSEFMKSIVDRKETIIVDQPELLSKTSTED